MQIKNSSLINDVFDCTYVNLGTSTTIDEIGKRGLTKLFRFVSIWFNVLYQLIKFKPELCYFAITAKGPAFYKDASIAMLLKVSGVKLVYHFHNKGVSTKHTKWLDNLVYQLVFKNSDVILLSKYLYPDIEKYVPNERVHYCPNGIPDVVDSNLVLILKEEERTAVSILFLSNLIASKGIYVLLEACKILHNKKLNFHCTFVGGIGDVSEKQFNGKLQEFNLERCVNYVGKKYGVDKDLVFAKADIFVFPTYYHNETFGLVNLEAMQHSLPIVSTFEGGIPDVVEDGITGFLVKQKDVRNLADKLETLIKNPELRRQMGAAGRAKYEKEFTLKKFENTFTTILTKVLNNNKYLD
jgi:glycosyltransferase involved in cell wall biosynthesis